MGIVPLAGWLACGGTASNAATSHSDAAPTSSTGSTASTGSTTVAQVFVVAMENENIGQIYGNSAEAPYINQTLIPTSARATEFIDELGLSVPSEPHYVWMGGGDERLRGSHLHDRRFAVREQQHGHHGASGYLCHDMHGASGCPGGDLVQAGDDWLSLNLPPLIAFANARAAVVFLVWDEGDASGHVPFMAIGPGIKPGYAGSQTYTHSSLLKTIEEILGLPILPAVTAANDLSDLFAPGAAPSSTPP